MLNSQPSKPQLSRENIEAIFPLRPNQSAMLLADSPANDQAAGKQGLIQLRMKLHGKLDRMALENAWHWTTDRHQTLRMSVHQKGTSEPRLIAWKSVTPEINFHDLQELSEDSQQAKLKFVLTDNRAAGLSPKTPPANIVDVYQLGTTEHFLIWRSHHLFLDGWSSAIVVDELMSVYHDFANDGRPESPKPVCTYSDYLQWLGNHDQSASKKFWAEHLTPFNKNINANRATLQAQGTLADQTLETVEVVIDQADSVSLANAIAKHQLTINSACQGIWSVLLRKLTGCETSVFATVDSARPASLDGSDRIVGMLANQIPVCISFNKSLSAADWFRTIRDQVFAAQSHSMIPMAEMAELPIHLIDSLLVVQNFPTVLAESDSHAPSKGQLTVSNYRSDLATSLPLAVSIVPGKQWTIQVQTDSRVVPAGTTKQIAECCKQLLLKICGGFDDQLATWLDTPEGDPLTDALVRKAKSETTSPLTNTTTAPRTETETRLAMIWSETLGLPQASTRDNFFESGGKSITAIRLFAKIEQVFGQKLSPSLLMSHSTIESLAGLIDQGDGTGTSVLVPIRKQGNRTPLLGVHAGGDYSFYYRHLARHLDPQQPVWGIHPSGLEGIEEPHRTIEETASFNNEQLLREFPGGDVHLAGYCVGAAVCVEMARQLEVAGVHIKSITVLDSGPALNRPLKLPLSKFMKSDPAKSGLRKFLNYCRYRCSLIKQQLRSIYVSLAARLLGNREHRRRYLMERVDRITRKAFTSFSQRPVASPILLIRSKEYAERADKTFHLDWANLTTDLRIEVAEAKHDSLLLEPDVQRVAAILNSHLPD